jgi:DNA-binding beta-propeller fold protein YncE
MNKLTCAALSAAAISLAASGANYHVIKQIKIGGEGSWDYLTMDSQARRLYVSHATKVVVLDVDSGKVAGEIADTPGVHGIALAPKLNRGFTSNGAANSATIFDLKTLQRIGDVKTGTNPDAIQYEPISERVFTFNRSKDVTVFDGKTGKIQATIPIGGKPEFSVTDGKGMIYVNIEDTSEIVALDARKLRVDKRYPLKPCESPSGLAIDVGKRLLFSVCDNNVMAISNPDSGKVVSTQKIGDEPDGAGFDPESELAFSANRNGTLTVVGNPAGKWQVIENAATKPGARTMAVDEKTHLLYLPVGQFGAVPKAVAGAPKPRPPIVPNTFEILVVGR